jgi:hypothetical protein
VLDTMDFLLITGIVIVFAGGSAAATAYLRPADRARIKRLEDKLDLVLKHLGLDFVSATRTGWQEIASDSNRKIEAIKAYREETGAGLADAKRAVEDYMEGRRGD